MRAKKRGNGKDGYKGFITDTKQGTGKIRVNFCEAQQAGGFYSFFVFLHWGITSSRKTTTTICKTCKHTGSSSNCFATTAAAAAVTITSVRLVMMSIFLSSLHVIIFTQACFGYRLGGTLRAPSFLVTSGYQSKRTTYYLPICVILLLLGLVPN